VFDNLVARYRDRKNNVSVVAVGPDIYADPAARSTARSAFDGNVVCDFERMEQVLDYIFINLGIDTSNINHPILLTEPACAPQNSRKCTSNTYCYTNPPSANNLRTLQ
jgi:actin-related protein 5